MGAFTGSPDFPFRDHAAPGSGRNLREGQAERDTTLHFPRDVNQTQEIGQKDSAENWNKGSL